MSFDGETAPLPQLYMDGCGFQTMGTTTSDRPFEVVARYADRNAYSFFYPQNQQTQTCHDMASIVRSKPIPERNLGGIFLSGNHIESCVPNSNLLRFFHSAENSAKTYLLSDSDHAALIEAQQNAREKIIPLLRSTLN